APSAAMRRACPTARTVTAARGSAAAGDASGTRSPSPEKESGVTLTMPMTYVRAPQVNVRDPMRVSAGPSIDSPDRSANEGVAAPPLASGRASMTPSSAGSSRLPSTSPASDRLIGGGSSGAARSGRRHGDLILRFRVAQERVVHETSPDLANEVEGSGDDQRPILPARATPQCELQGGSDVRLGDDRPSPVDCASAIDRGPRRGQPFRRRRAWDAQPGADDTRAIERPGAGARGNDPRDVLVAHGRHEERRRRGVPVGAGSDDEWQQIVERDRK